MWLLWLTALQLTICYSLTPEEIALFTPRNPNHVEINTGLKSIVSIIDNRDGSLTVYSNGIPSHDTWEFPTTANPNELKEKIISYKVNKDPIMRIKPLTCIPHGNIGVATSGVVIDAWFASEKGCPYAVDFEELDICEGHPTPDGQYHYHHYSPCVQMPTCGKPSPIYGVAIDGIPIYGPWDEDGKQLTNQDLDKCGGRTDKAGRYKYHVTIDPPYTMGCIMGEIRNDLGQDPSVFYCSCPFDDSMMRDSSGAKPDFSDGPPPDQADGGQEKPDIPTMCNFTGPGAESARCVENYNTSYVMSRKWIEELTLTTLAGCCPEGQNCGLSCKKAKNSTEKTKCTYETRTISMTKNVASGSTVQESMCVIICALAAAIFNFMALS